MSRCWRSPTSSAAAGLPGVGFRTLNDEHGECATLLTLLFDDADKAKTFCDAIGSKPISASGWHVYNNMEQLLNQVTGNSANCPFHCPLYSGEATYQTHMLPQTDSILDRAVNISIGVVDGGLGSGYGININSTDQEITAVGRHLKEIITAL